MRIVFFGTPGFAVASLQALLHNRFTVAGVVTQPDKPQGRSRSELIPPPVKVAALAAGIPVLQPVRPVGDVFAASLRRLEPDLGVVVAYGHILRPDVLSVPPRGMINVHASLLPRHRGAAPIQHAILAGDRETGISIMQMEEGLDSGPVLHHLVTPIGHEETAGDLAGRLAELGATALVEAISLYSSGRARPVPQDQANATYAPKFDREQARVAWQREAPGLVQQIRAFDPAPGAWTELNGSTLKLFGGQVAAGSGEPGTVLQTGGRLVVAAGTGAVAVSEVQPAGKTRIPVEAWLRGRGVTVGERLT
ncbi:MAG: methionyl-tRNA formyltransferase [Gemmatimonadales bacterium]|nr:methionyl-tRNA formyltransferase [Gemmatimonadales bacterium]MDQ3208321.1 methionyl-tRNA formyltransferase [Gemmatimonadota bacterium]